MQERDFERALLALESWREASNEGVESMLAIAWSIHNLSKRDSSSLGEAIIKHKSLHGLEFNAAPEFPDCRDPRFTRLLQRVSDVGTPQGEDLTNGGIVYIVPTIGSERVQELVKDGHTLCATSARRHWYK